MTIQERDDLLKDVRIGGLNREPTENDKWEIAKFVEKIKKDNQNKEIIQ